MLHSFFPLGITIENSEKKFYAAILLSSSFPFFRRVWIGLLEKNIPFVPIQINLKDGEEFKP